MDTKNQKGGQTSIDINMHLIFLQIIRKKYLHSNGIVVTQLKFRFRRRNSQNHGPVDLATEGRSILIARGIGGLKSRCGTGGEK
jgi:hypothetical protein